jgi:hypothetical protein
MIAQPHLGVAPEWAQACRDRLWRPDDSRSTQHQRNHSCEGGQDKSDKSQDGESAFGFALNQAKDPEHQAVTGGGQRFLAGHRQAGGCNGWIIRGGAAPR